MKIHVRHWVYCKFGVALSPYAQYEAERLTNGRFLVAIDETLFVMVRGNNVEVVG